MPKLTVLLAICSMFVIPLNAQPLDPAKELSQYNIDHWDDEHSPSNILEIIQTKDGYLWMVTLKGLARFDGVKLTHYDKFSNPELEVNGFKTAFEDSHQRLWLGSIGGGAFIKSGNRFQQILLPFGPGSNNIERITETQDQTIWLCTLKGLVSYRDSVFTLYTPANTAESADFPVYDFIQDGKKNRWVATAQGLMLLSDRKLIPVQNAGFGKIGEIIDMHLSSDQKLWLASYSRGVYTYREGKLQRIAGLDPEKRPMKISEDRNKNIWIGSENGVARYTNGRISRLSTATGLSHNNVTAVCEDHEGSIWLGTYYGGVNRLRDGTFTNYTTYHGLPHNTIHAIFQGKDSTIWFGAETDIAYKKHSVITKLSDRYPELRSVRVRDVLEDAKGNLWIASYEGLFLVKGNTIKKFNVVNGLSSDQTRIVFEDSKGTIWVGTRQGLNKLNGDRWVGYSSKEGLLNDFVMSISERHNGDLLVGTTGGIFVMSGSKFQPLTVGKKTLGITTFVFSDVDPERLWIATSNGLMLVSDNSIHEFNRDARLGRNIYQILEDNTGALWLSSDAGIVRALKADLLNSTRSDTTIVNARLFDKSSGLRTNEITPTGRGIMAADGKLWFPTLEGVSCVDPTNIVVNTTPPPINIEKVLIGGKEYDWTQPINAPPGSRNIEIHYTGLSFMIPKKVNFKYKLEGFDKDWHDAGERRVAYYSALPPGSYTFSIEASNNDGVWNTAENVFVLRVERAFWQTAPFYIFASLTAILLIIGIIHLRTRNVKRLNVRLEEKIHERTQEVIQQKEEIESQRDYIETKNHELEKARALIEQQYEKLREINENLEAKVEDRTSELKLAYEELMAVNKELDDFVYKSAHDIKGPLARLQGLCNLALMEAGKLPTREYLLKLQRESQLANRVIEKLAHTYEVKHHTLFLADVPLVSLVNEVIKMIRMAYPEETVHTTFDVRIAPHVTLRTDKRLISEALFNLLENATIFRAEINPTVIIEADPKDGGAELLITDNGIGMDARVRGEIFKMFVKGSERSQGLGLGLYIAKMAVELLGGAIALVSAEPGETRFRIELPSGDVFASNKVRLQKTALRYSLD